MYKVTSKISRRLACREPRAAQTQTQRERDRERDRDRETERERETDRQTETERHTGTHSHRHTHTHLSHSELPRHFLANSSGFKFDGEQLVSLNEKNIPAPEKGKKRREEKQPNKQERRWP